MHIQHTHAYIFSGNNNLNKRKFAGLALCCSGARLFVCRLPGKLDNFFYKFHLRIECFSLWHLSAYRKFECFSWLPLRIIHSWLMAYLSGCILSFMWFLLIESGLWSKRSFIFSFRARSLAYGLLLLLLL